MSFLPAEFLNSLKNVSGLDIAALDAVHAEGRPVTSVRLNPLKPAEHELPVSGRVPWSENGYYLSTRPRFTFDPLFHAGCYYVQEPGSMFLELALRTHAKLEHAVALDLCAAPGGKSTLLAGMLSRDSVVVSNEIISSRAGVLLENMGRWGTANSIVTNNDPSQLAENGLRFDIIVVDAPCSGSGLFRKDPDALLQWNSAAPGSCAARQRKILESALHMLAGDGVLFYSTCSYSKEENEDIVSWLISDFGMEFLSVETEADWGIEATPLGYRFYPYRTQTEGFFAACLRKTGRDTTRWHAGGRRLETVTGAERNTFAEYFNGDLEFGSSGGGMFAGTRELMHVLSQLDPAVYVRKAGIKTGGIKGKDYIPAQEAAWCVELKDNRNVLELSKENAVRYLQRESIPTDGGARGIRLVTYGGQGLGWAKVLEQRVNNYLPPGLRILTR